MQQADFFSQVPFDYLKVVNFDPTDNNHYSNWQEVFPIDCLYRTSAHIKYADNSDYSISFDIYDNGGRAFKCLHAGSLILAGEQIFVIQSITKKYQGAATFTVNAVQVVNAWIDRLKQNKALTQNNSNSSDDSSNTSKLVHVNLKSLLDWFTDGVSLYMGPQRMSFRFHQVGYFPVRPLKNVKGWSGKQLFTQIIQAWPGTIIIGVGFDIYICGYQEKRDKQGNLQNVLNHDTQKRFDAMANASNIEVTEDASRLCNAIEVKAATHSVQAQQSEGSDDEEEDGDEFVTQTVPYFKPFVATAEGSINKYGLYPSPDVMDQGFTNAEAALVAAREKMVLEPVVTVKATIDHPGKTEICPTPGDEYTIGTGEGGDVYHVIVRGYDWYPFDSSKGCQLTLDNVDPGIIEILRTTIVHDTELSPTVTNFKMLEDDDDDQDDSTDDTSGDDDDGSLQQVNSDDGTDRPDDTPQDSQGDGNDQPATPTSFKAYLPISDKGTNAHISRLGNFTLNKDNDDFNIRVTDNQHLQKLRDGTWQKDDAKNSQWKHVMKIDWANNLNATFEHQNYYDEATFYLGQTTLFKSGLITTTSKAFTFRDGVKDSDYGKNGKLKHYRYKKNGDWWYPDYSDKNPGKLALIQAGTFQGTSTARSRLSLKENVKPLDKDHALDVINNTDIATYNYKQDDAKETQASLVIDDVNNVKKWNAPKELLTADGKNRNDSKTIGYLVAAVQALTDKVNSQDEEIKELKKQLSK